MQKAINVLLSAGSAVSAIVLKEFLSNPQHVLTPVEWYALLIVIFVSFGVIVALIQWGLPELYRFSLIRSLRRHLSRLPDLEGLWVDVGIDESATLRRLKNCSFITIKEEDPDTYKIEGITWNNSGAEEATWHSESSKIDGKQLTFWYEAEEKGSKPKRKIHRKAIFDFSGEASRKPTQFSGSYDENFWTKAVRSPKQYVTSVDERYTLAEKYMEDYRKDNNFDTDYIERNLTSIGTGDIRRKWFRAFLRTSDEKSKEKALIEKMLSQLPKAGAILDIGPGDGSLSALVLSKISNPNKKSSYVCIDRSGEHLDDTEKMVSPYVNQNGARFIKGNIESEVGRLGNCEFELIIAFNVFYFVSNLKTLWENLIQKLSSGGTFLCLHTNISGDSFLSTLIRDAGSNINCDVVEHLDKIAGTNNLSLFKEAGNIKLTFPEVKTGTWDAIERGEVSQHDYNAQESVKLICFLIDRDMQDLIRESKWQSITKRVRAHLLEHHNEVDLPVVVQALQKTAEIC